MARPSGWVAGPAAWPCWTALTAACALAAEERISDRIYFVRDARHTDTISI